VIAAVLEARRRSATSVSVACNAGSAAGKVADITIDVVVGPEFVAGSTRLKAGTAQKLVLNMLTTLTMVRSKTYGNRMVDVRAPNAKLVARAFSLVQDITGAADPFVAAALDADGEVKKAVAVILTGLPAASTRECLTAASGSLRAVISLTVLFLPSRGAQQCLMHSNSPSGSSTPSAAPRTSPTSRTA